MILSEKKSNEAYYLVEIEGLKRDLEKEKLRVEMEVRNRQLVEVILQDLLMKKNQDASLAMGSVRKMIDDELRRVTSTLQNDYKQLLDTSISPILNELDKYSAKFLKMSHFCEELSNQVEQLTYQMENLDKKFKAQEENEKQDLRCVKEQVNAEEERKITEEEQNEKVEEEAALGEKKATGEVILEKAEEHTVSSVPQGREKFVVEKNQDFCNGHPYTIQNSPTKAITIEQIEEELSKEEEVSSQNKKDVSKEDLSDGKEKALIEGRAADQVVDGSAEQVDTGHEMQQVKDYVPQAALNELLHSASGL